MSDTAHYIINQGGESRQVSEDEFDAKCDEAVQTFNDRFSPPAPDCDGEYLLCFRGDDRCVAFRMDARTRQCDGTTTGTAEKHYIGMEHDDIVLCMFSILKGESGYPSVGVWTK